MAPGRAPLLRLLLLLGVLGGAASGPHSLRYFDVAVSEPGPGVPEFMFVGYVDGNPIARYDSDTGKVVSRADWMAANLDQEYWNSQTQIGLNNQQMSRVNLETARGYYNQSRGVHTVQRMIGCDLLEDGSTRGYHQYAYDGKDYISLDVDTMTFTAADEAAQNTKRKWEKDGTVAEQWKHYVENTCIEWLRRYVSYGHDVLERKEPPAVRVSASEAHGILTLRCRAFGFYPRPIGVSWLKDGEVRDQDTEWGGIVPNGDGTYYTWAAIEARPEDRDRYRCRVDHASLPEPRLFASEPESSLLTISVAVAAAILVVTAVVAAVAVWRYRSGKKQKGYGVAPSADGGSGGSKSAAQCSAPEHRTCGWMRPLPQGQWEEVATGPTATVPPQRSHRNGPTTTVPPHWSHRNGPAATVPPQRSHHNGPTTLVPPQRSRRNGPAATVPPQRSHRAAPGRAGSSSGRGVSLPCSHLRSLAALSIRGYNRFLLCDLVSLATQ